MSERPHHESPAHTRGDGTTADGRGHLTLADDAGPSRTLRHRIAAHFAAWWPVWVAWAASRMGVLAVGFLSQYASSSRDLPGVTFLTAGTFPHFESVVQNGYTHENAFEFPLMPALMWLLSFAGIPIAAGGFLVANLAFLGGLLAMAMLGERYVGRPAALRAAIYLAIFPTSYAFSIVSTESLMLLGIAGAALYAVRGNWWAAAGFAFFCAMTRPPAIFVAIILTGIALQQLWVKRQQSRAYGEGQQPGALPWWLPSSSQAVAIVAAPLGLLTFFAYLQFRLGDFMAAIHAQEQFGREMQPLGPITAVTSAITDLTSGVLGPFVELIGLVVAVGAVTWFALKASGGRWEIAGWVAFVAASLLLPLSTGIVWQIPRFVLLMPPVFWALGMIGNRRWLDQGLIMLLPMALAFKVVFEVVGVER